MRNKPIVLTLLIALLFLAGACGPDRRKTGETLPTNFPTDSTRLPDRSPSPSPDQSGPSVHPPSGPAKPDEKPAEPEEKFFDVSMVADSPYFEPGNELHMPVGFTLRVTNNDSTAERPTRSFTAESGAFDSEPMVHGQVWTHKFSGPGRYKVVDHKAPFIFATLEVS